MLGTLATHWKHRNPRIAKTVLNNIRNAGGITILHFELYCRARIVVVVVVAAAAAAAAAVVVKTHETVKKQTC